MVEFLLDENVLGLARFLEDSVKYRSVGGNGCPEREAEDQVIVQFAHKNDLIIITKDAKMVDACKFRGVKYVTHGDEDLARKIIEVANNDRSPE